MNEIATKLKSHLTCSQCKKILKNPIELPCQDCICKEHLAEKDVQKLNKIKCSKCGQEFEVNGIEFKSFKAFQKLLDDQVYLTNEEISLKQKTEESLRMFYANYEQLTLNKIKLDYDIYNHFQELRFQIDEHREELKQKIDDIALNMIERTRKYEASYLKAINEKLDDSLNTFETHLLEQDLKEMEDKFRDPNLLFESMQEIQIKQEKALNEIQLKLNQVDKLKASLNVLNKFEPNVSFDQESFGLLDLNPHSNIDPFQSQILTDKQALDLVKLCQFSLKDSWSLLYRGTRDGFSANSFHLKCDGHLSTLTILKASGTSYIFGGFTSQAWQSPTPARVKADPNAFLFSLINKDNTPCLMRTSDVDQSIVCNPSYGPVFGLFPADIVVAFNLNSTTGSYSNLGKTYAHPQYVCGSNEARTFLAGSEYFQLSEIEVYKKDE